MGAVVGGLIASGAVDYVNEAFVDAGGAIGDKVGDGLDAAGEAIGDAAEGVKDFFGF